MRRMKLVMILVPAMLCVAAGTAAALSCIAANTETLEFVPTRIEIDGVEVDVNEFGSATFTADESEGRAWIRLDNDEGLIEVYFQRVTEAR